MGCQITLNLSIDSLCHYVGLHFFHAFVNYSRQDYLVMKPFLCLFDFVYSLIACLIAFTSRAWVTSEMTFNTRAKDSRVGVCMYNYNFNAV